MDYSEFEYNRYWYNEPVLYEPIRYHELIYQYSSSFRAHIYYEFPIREYDWEVVDGAWERHKAAYLEEFGDAPQLGGQQSHITGNEPMLSTGKVQGSPDRIALDIWGDLSRWAPDPNHRGQFVVYGGRTDGLD